MDSGGRHHGFIYNGGFITLDDPNAVDTYAAKVNDSGQIVGAYYSGGQPFGFLYSGGTFTTLGFFPAGINDSEEMVGYSGGNGGNYLLLLRRSCNKYLYT